MKNLLFILLLLPFWSTATSDDAVNVISPVFNFESHNTFDEEQDTYDVDHQQRIKEHKFSRRRRINALVDFKLALAINATAGKLCTYKQLCFFTINKAKRVIADIAHCHRMTPF